MKSALKRGVVAGALKQAKGVGAAGSFKLGDKTGPAKKKIARKPKAPGSPAKKKAPAKPKAAKKPKSSPKKPASPKKV